MVHIRYSQLFLDVRILFPPRLPYRGAARVRPPSRPPDRHRRTCFFLQVHRDEQIEMFNQGRLRRLHPWPIPIRSQLGQLQEDPFGPYQGNFLIYAYRTNCTI